MGIGIAADQLGMQFNKFARVDTSSTRRYGGTGLGLVISRRLAGMMDGEIEVQNVEGGHRRKNAGPSRDGPAF